MLNKWAGGGGIAGLAGTTMPSRMRVRVVVSVRLNQKKMK